MPDYILDLQKIGLSDKEAKVYLAALELGADTAQNISKRAGVNRATTYVAIKALTDNGLMSTFEKEKKQYFTALSPDNLLDLYERARLEAEEKRAYTERIMPHLKRIQKKLGEKTRVKYFEGKDALLSMVSNFYKEMAGGIVYSFSPIDKVRKIFSKGELDSLQEIRLAKNVKTRGIYIGETKIESRPDLQAKMVQADKFPLNSDVAIYGDKVRIVTLGDNPAGIVIEDKDFAETLRSIFNLAWEGAE